MNFLEIFGTLASITIFLSLMMSSIVKLRWINLFGSLLFAVYGYLIGSFSTMFLNIGIVVIDIYYLKKLYFFKDDFEIIETDINTSYFKYFLKRNKNDIQKYFDFDKIMDADIAYYLLRNNYLVGILMMKKVDNDVGLVSLDYVTPKFRDMKFGNYLYNQNKELFLSKGYRKIVQKTNNTVHQNYLLEMGFVKTDSNTFTKSL
ncbi:MAG: GNAT family N-acetyltransferase [Cetobacterium sp.]|uniref:GNAT family N-acetyltransferase n=1 Tax=Cetobacterium sp. TaxID=2071632 RepID=UPI002FC725B8